MASDPLLSTSRIELVNVNPETDAPLINALMLDSFDTLQPWKLWGENPPSIDDTRRMMKGKHDNNPDGDSFSYGIFSKEHNKIIGMCGILKLRSSFGDRIRSQIDSPSYRNPWLLGYWLNKNYEKKGYVSEACRLLIDYASSKIGVDCFLAHVDPANEKSSKVVERLGFSLLKTTTMKNMGARSDWPDDIPCHVYVLQK